MGSKTFDYVDGGIAACFKDGPKKGQVGTVVPDDGVPPKVLRFFNGRLIYVREKRTTVHAADALQRVKAYKGVRYAVDPECAFMKEVQAELAAAEAGQSSGKFEVQR